MFFKGNRGYFVGQRYRTQITIILGIAVGFFIVGIQGCGPAPVEEEIRAKQINTAQGGIILPTCDTLPLQFQPAIAWPTPGFNCAD
jgi:hypothetical protein